MNHIYQKKNLLRTFYEISKELKTIQLIKSVIKILKNLSESYAKSSCFCLDHGNYLTNLSCWTFKN